MGSPAPAFRKRVWGEEKTAFGRFSDFFNRIGQQQKSAKPSQVRAVIHMRPKPFTAASSLARPDQCFGRWPRRSLSPISAQSHFRGKPRYGFPE